MPKKYLPSVTRHLADISVCQVSLWLSFFDSHAAMVMDPIMAWLVWHGQDRRSKIITLTLFRNRLQFVPSPSLWNPSIMLHSALRQTSRYVYEAHSASVFLQPQSTTNIPLCFLRVLPLVLSYSAYETVSLNVDSYHRIKPPPPFCTRQEVKLPGRIGCLIRQRTPWSSLWVVRDFWLLVLVLHALCITLMSKSIPRSEILFSVHGISKLEEQDTKKRRTSVGRLGRDIVCLVCIFRLMQFV